MKALKYNSEERKNCFAGNSCKLQNEESKSFAKIANCLGTDTLILEQQQKYSEKTSSFG